MKDDERTIENAPEIFRERLKNLKGRGLLDDPEFKQAFINAVRRVTEQQRAEQTAQGESASGEAGDEG